MFCSSPRPCGYRQGQPDTRHPAARVCESGPGWSRFAGEGVVRVLENGGWGPAGTRLAAKTDVRGSDECWLWTGYVATDGYGRIGSNWKVLKTHRLAYELAYGPIPAGLVIDHLCHNRAGCTGKGRDCLHRRCVNPLHLEATTMRINTLRGNQFPFGNDHCKRGHEFTPENTDYAPDGRRCRTCRRLAYARRRATEATK